MMTPLDQIAEVNSGYAFRGKVESEDGGSLAVLQLKDVSDLESDQVSLDQGVPSDAVRICPESGHYKYQLRANDILLQVRGTQFKVAAFSSDLPAIAAQGVAYIRAQEQVVPEYLLWYLRHPNTVDALRRLAKGTHIPFISKKALGKLLVAVPSVNTQHRIIAADRVRAEQRKTLERLMTLNDQLVDAATWRAANHSRKTK